MADGKMTRLEELAEELRKGWRQVYTTKEIVQFWGGSNYPKPFVYFNTKATRDTITHFVDGVGDFNPLYRDGDYAKETKYGRVIAPPCFVFSIVAGVTAPAVRKDIIGWNAGYELEWFRPICEGDTIDWKAVFPSDLEMKESKMGGKSLLASSETEYTDQGGEAIALCREWTVLVETSKAVEMQKYAGLVKLHEYSDEELREIYATQDREVVRGSNLRYWEDVELGEELTPVVHGPLNLAETLAWLIGCGTPLCKSDRLYRKIDMYDRVVVDPVTKTKLNLELIHLDDRVARMIGIPAAYDFGIQRVAWLGVLLTNWMGDEGFLWKLRGEFRRFNMTGDTSWCKGKVKRRYTDNGRYCVDIECWSENQRGEITMPGRATVILPSKENGPVVYPPPQHIT